MRLFEETGFRSRYFKFARAMHIHEAAHFRSCAFDFGLSGRMRRALLRKREVDVI
jgi:hypothetical protein